MADNAIFKDYLMLIEQAYKAGNATEHTHRPALKDLLEAFQPDVTATNEPKRIKCGAPDYIITRKDIPLGFVEAKDIGVSLDDTEKSEQLKRYRDGLANLILTDYLEFRWYVSGELRLTARLAKPQTNGKLRVETEGVQQLAELLQHFFAENIPVISSPKELATRMAALARLIRTIIGKTFAEEGEHGALHEQMEGFRKVLLHDLTAEQFGDMYAQTICYGLFAARCNQPISPRQLAGEGLGERARFTRTHAAYDLPKTNPFLRKLFAHIAGPELDERIVWAVDNLAELLNRADIAAILQDFGRATRQEDPVVHFYETFLGAYDQKMREARGVYYTPEPVVSYIVRSVDAILKKDFKLRDGLADASKIKLTRPKLRGKGTETIETHKVQILDPATGTGTFLYSVIGQIYQTFAGNKGMWPGYVQENLLPRVYGFELLMAPYAVAHMKLGLLLRETGYDFSSDERLRVFLTNTLEEAHEMTGLPLFTQWLADEATSANLVKKETPVMVVLGNPPYSGHSENKGAWITGLMEEYKRSLELKKPGQTKWLSDDYVKFIRFAQWRIEQTGYGVLAFVTNHGYLENPTFCDMRQSLMQSFDDIYLLDLHGNSNRKEKAPDGSKDENVFDIQQGVAIGLFVKRGKDQDKPTQVYHADVYGTRESKYAGLAENDVTSTGWKSLQPQAPFYLFVPQDEMVRDEYSQYWHIPKIFSLNGDPAPGIVTTHDDFAISWSREEAINKVERLLATTNEIEARSLFKLCSQNQWNYARAKEEMSDNAWRNQAHEVLYRPFDTRWTIYNRNVAVHKRDRVMQHMLTKGNLGLATTRSTEIERGWEHLLCTNGLITLHTVSIKEINYIFPLYLHTSTKSDLFDDSIEGSRRANLSPEFIADFSTRLQLSFVVDGCGDLRKTFGPEDVFHYAYAVFYSPTYRSRYAEFLKGDFPRLPLTRDVALFRNLCASGKELVALHLIEQLPKLETRYPEAGDNTVDAVRYTEPGNGVLGRVWINQTQYFDNVPPEVWGYHIGGYRVCQKWLKDRKGRQLSYDDLTHYRGIVAALARTIELQAAIDDAIGEWPLQ